MKQGIKVFHNSHSLWSKFLESNPQLFREIKGRLKTKNVVIAAAVSIITQFIVVISLLGELPETDLSVIAEEYSRYCLGANESKLVSNTLCTKDLLDNWIVNWQLLWLDLFIALSVISIFSLLLIGTYLLVADVVKEEERGTFNFIRLSPQSASSILLGKALGVPILLYTAVLLMLPLHLMAGLNAHIPLPLILGFDVVLVASCGFVYSLALLWSLINTGFAGFKPWLASGILGFFLFSTTTALFDGYTNVDHPLSWLLLFNPSVVISYLAQSTFIPDGRINFVSADKLAELRFYGQALWTKASLGLSFILFNFAVWTYWCWSVLQRRFQNPNHTLISKAQSYWLTGWFVIFALGFTLQDVSSSRMSDNFALLQVCFCILQLGLIAALSPHRQALHDWVRYRHQAEKKDRFLWKELVLGENSPSTIAIAINLAIGVVYITPSIFMMLGQDKYSVFWGFALGALSILFCAVVAQLVLTIKSRKRAVWSTISVATVIILPPTLLGLAEVHPQSSPLAWLFSFVPVVATEYATNSAVILAILGQCLAISLVSMQMARKLKQAGASETKMLLSKST